MTDARERPTHCEIPGCRSVYCGTTSSGTPVRKCGKADVFVEQNGKLRGVCQRCYAEITDRAGTSRMAELKDAKGNFDPVKVREHVPDDAQTQLPIRRTEHAAQPIADVLGGMTRDGLDDATPPDWFGDRP